MNVIGGTTDVTTYFVLRTAATGVELTGATITGIDLQYTRTGAAPVTKVDATALAATNSAHADNKAIQIDATSSPGLYRVDWPDLAFAAGARQVILSVLYATAFTEHMAVDIDTPVDVAKISTDATAADNLELFTDGTGYAGGTTKLNVNASTITDGAITATTIATGAIDADAIAADAIGASELASDAVAEIADAVWDELSTGHVTAGKAGEQLWTDVDAVLADTGTDGVLLATGAVTAAVIATGAIDADAIADNAIDAGAIATGAITAAKIADGAIDAATFAAGAIDAAAIATGAVDADALATDAITEIVTAIFAKTGLTVGGVVTFGNIIKAIYAHCRGGIEKSSNVFTYKDDDDATTVFTLTGATTGRTVA